MPVMDIRKVRVAMAQGSVFVHMAMRLGCIPLKGVFMHMAMRLGRLPLKGMFMLMVLVVNVRMVMGLRIVLMFV